MPHAKTDKRIHFYIPSGRLQGHVFVRHNDGIDWTGKRREGTGETEVWKTKKGKRKRNRKVQTTGERKRIGTISHGVGIGIPQMPMNRSADEIQEQVGQYAMERLLHYEEGHFEGNRDEVTVNAEHVYQGAGASGQALATPSLPNQRRT